LLSAFDAAAQPPKPDAADAERTEPAKAVEEAAAGAGEAAP
jgi:hypothetical protein